MRLSSDEIELTELSKTEEEGEGGMKVGRKE